MSSFISTTRSEKIKTASLYHMIILRNGMVGITLLLLNKESIVDMGLFRVVSVSVR